MDSITVWYFMRSSGVVLLVLLTLSVTLGVFATKGNAGSRIPRFVTQDLHRNISLLSVVFLVIHVGTAVLHSYVDIRWFDAFVPGAAVYRPLWVGMGAAALDLIAVVVVTSLLRHRLSQRAWRAVHLATYFSWGMAVLHGFGMGTDARTVWMLWVQGACVVAFFSAISVRLGTRNLASETAAPTGRGAPAGRGARLR